MSTHSWQIIPTLVLLVACIGCDSTEPITTYTIPTRAPSEFSESRQRMLAAMVPQETEVWFFKVTGPEDAIEVVAGDFRSFVEGIEWNGDEPKLTELPQKWTLGGGGSQFRFATITVDTPGKQLDVSVSKLGRQSDWDAMVASNVNRWRGQLGLEPSQEEWASAEPLDVKTVETKSVWVDIVGDTLSTSMSSGMPPMAGRPPGAPRAASPGGSSSSAKAPLSPPPMLAMPDASTADQPFETDPKLKFDRPEGWRDGRMSSMRMAAFSVGPEESAAEITVIPAGGDLRGNVARWLGQVRSEVAPDEVVDAAMEAAETVEVDGREGKRFFLTAGESADAADATAIDATIVPMDDGMSLFIKMTGPQATVEDQSKKIADFLASLKLQSEN